LQYAKGDLLAKYTSYNTRVLAAIIPEVFISDEELKLQTVEVLIDAGQASVSYLQRKLKLGYARAARLMDELEADGVVGHYQSSMPRKVLVTKEQWREQHPPKKSNESHFDPLKAQAIEVLIEAKMATVSLLQQKLKLGYSKAARLMDELEVDGIVGSYQGARPRDVLITKEQWQNRK
jgi:DNA segregation ATPase FtsK/SpoIIIE-like protein